MVSTQLICSDNHKLQVILCKNNENTYLTIPAKWRVDFNVDYSIAPILGFVKSDHYEKAGTYNSKNTIMIQGKSPVIMLRASFTEPSYFQGTLLNYIYQYIINVAPGYNIVDIPTVPQYKPLKTNVLDVLEMELTNTDGELLDSNGEKTTIELTLRSTPKEAAVTATATPGQKRARVAV